MKMPKKVIYLKNAISNIIEDAGVSDKAVSESAITDAGFKKVYKKAFRTPFSEDDIEEINELCNENTEIIVAGGDVATNKILLYARDNCK